MGNAYVPSGFDIAYVQKKCFCEKMYVGPNDVRRKTHTPLVAAV